MALLNLASESRNSASKARYDQWLETMFLYCSSETYDLDAFKAFLADGDDETDLVKRQFEEVLAARPFTASDWRKEMNFAHKSDADLCDFLSALYEFLFCKGPYPNWD